jgi:hypothetical protein
MRNEQRDTSWLAFADPDGRLLTREFVVRGGIAWPRVINHEAVGHVVTLAQDIHSGRITLLAEAEYRSISSTRALDGTPLHLGDFTNRAWVTAGCLTYYAAAQADDTERGRRELHRARTIQPKPLVFALLPRAADVLHALADARDREVVAMPGESVVLEQLGRFEVSPGANPEEYPALWSFGAALLGLREFPWRGQAEGYDVLVDDEA